ncbi:MAG: rhodanese-like domain-containing protein, partial [Spirochaetia bacterium]|nr:rhodanese-like domain-containing protein [Spirochaetia bacterium]
MLNWNFLTSDIEEDALILDCRSEDQYKKSTIKGAFSAAFIKKPYGSGPQSMIKLSGFLKSIQNLQNKKKVIVFDEGQGMYACRMLWLLFGIDIENAKIL